MGIPGQARRYTRRQMLASSAVLIMSACSAKPTPPKLAEPSRPVSKPPALRPNIVVFLADALRADHLGCYGHSVATSPTIDALSKHSIVFERCYSQAPWTKPSVASIFTGVLPRVHQAGMSHWHIRHLHSFPVQRLREQFVTLAEALQEAGYHTVMFMGNAMLQKGFGFEQGFDKYWFTPGPAQGQMDKVVTWLEQEAREPFLLFVHEIDPHAPYRPSPEVFEQVFGVTPTKAFETLSGEDQKLLNDLELFYERRAKGLVKDRSALFNLSVEGFGHMAQLYDAEIAGMDRQVARLLRSLDDADFADRTAFVLTSDHGEAFNEHRNFHHGRTLFDEEIHVPLIIRPPGQAVETRVPWTISLYDLYPTLITLAGGTPPPPYVQAQALLDAHGKPLVAADRAVFSDLDHYVAEVDRWDGCMVVGTEKVMTHGHGQHTAFYDRAADPSERRDVLEGPQARELWLHRKLKAFLEEHEKHGQLAESFGEPEWTTGTEQLKDQLSALGYM